jgi:hypothetical protein
MHRYQLGGAQVVSELVLAGLADGEACGGVVISIRRGWPDRLDLSWVDHPEGAELTPDWVGVLYQRSTDGGWYRVRYDYHGHTADFGIRADGREIVIRAGDGEAEAEVANLVEGPILARATRLAGRPCLHATALSADGRAIALMGPSGAGKSSLAWALIAQGCGLVSDDMVGITLEADGPVTHPGRTCLRLWPDSVRRLGVGEGLAAVLFPTTPELAKTGVHGPARGPRRPLPLHAVYRLSPRRAGLRGALIEDLPHGERLAELAANLHGMIAPARALRQSELALLARVAAGTPIRSLTLPDDLDGLAETASGLKQCLFA